MKGRGQTCFVDKKILPSQCYYSVQLSTLRQSEESDYILVVKGLVYWRMTGVLENVIQIYSRVCVC